MSKDVIDAITRRAQNAQTVHAQDRIIEQQAETIKQLQARVARLEQGIMDSQNAFSLGAAENILNDVLFESPQQSLAHIEGKK